MVIQEALTGVVSEEAKFAVSRCGVFCLCACCKQIPFEGDVCGKPTASGHHAARLHKGVVRVQRDDRVSSERIT